MSHLLPGRCGTRDGTGSSCAGTVDPRVLDQPDPLDGRPERSLRRVPRLQIIEHPALLQRVARARRFRSVSGAMITPGRLLGSVAGRNVEVHLCPMVSRPGTSRMVTPTSVVTCQHQGCRRGWWPDRLGRSLGAWVAPPGPCVRCGGELPVRAGPVQAPGVGAPELSNAHPGQRSSRQRQLSLNGPLQNTQRTTDPRCGHAACRGAARIAVKGSPGAEDLEGVGGDDADGVRGPLVRRVLAALGRCVPMAREPGDPVV